MGFRNGAYAKVWEVKDGNGNYVDARISISRKKRDSDEYIREFSGWVRFAGEAAKQLTDESKIKIGECDVTNRYDQEKKVTYTNYVVFSYEFADGSAPSNVPTDENGFMSIPDVIDDELPFA